MSDEISLVTFQDLVNATFKVEDGDGQTAELVLVEVVVRDEDPRLESFSLFFLGVESPYFNQGSRNFIHDRLGKLTIFISPLGPKNGGMLYEAVFNRFRKDMK